MKRKTCTRIASILLILHGFTEIMTLFSIFAPSQYVSQMFENFGGMNKADIADNLMILLMFGVFWGIIRIIAALGILKMRKWAVVLGVIVSVVSLIAAISIIPFGLMDTIFAAPVLILLLMAWFEKTTLEV
jgi:hypothetical protein